MSNVYCSREIQKDNLYLTDSLTKVEDGKFIIKSNEDYQDSKLVVDTETMTGYFCFVDASEEIKNHVDRNPIYTVITEQQFEDIWNL